MLILFPVNSQDPTDPTLAHVTSVIIKVEPYIAFKIYVQQNTPFVI